ncbi:MAG TPA: GDP-mannose 4,6-dehydratase [Patescibacteria group bacterium]|nr:GDP-mannose 4,6-dehydratase [Patescibacteria group bacterium]
MKKALITGITGFAGSFLAENLVSTGEYEVSGTYLSDSSVNNVSSISDKVTLHKVDLQIEEEVNDLISNLKPDFIFHLAALTSPAESFKNPSEFINNNIDVEINLLEAVRRADIKPRILIVSSAETYGAVKSGDLPINENTPMMPVNPYAVSKLAQDRLGYQYFAAYKIPIVIIRPFNHIGPKQSPDFVVSSFAKKIAEIESGKTEPILKVGNLTAKRDFTDVKDMVEAYRLLLEKGEEGEAYNAGSGKSTEIKSILDTLLSFSDKQIAVEVDDSLLRPIDVPELVCDNTKIKAATGWEPKIPLEQTLKEVLDYWRSQG